MYWAGIEQLRTVERVILNLNNYKQIRAIDAS